MKFAVWEKSRSKKVKNTKIQSRDDKNTKKKHKSTNLDTCDTWSSGSLQSAKAVEGRKAKVQKNTDYKKTKMQKHKSTNLDTCETWPPGSLQVWEGSRSQKGKNTKTQITKGQK